MKDKIDLIIQVIRKAGIASGEKNRHSQLTVAVNLLNELREDAEAGIVFHCPRCKWQGKAYQLEQITKDGEVAIDYSDGSPVMGCPKCGEHKLSEE